MDRFEISRIAHSDHRICAPVSEERLRRLVSVLDLAAGGTVLDLGCGEGIWLLAAVEAHPEVRGVGLDLALPPDVWTEAERRGIADRVRWVEADASTWSDGAFDTVFCIGASHAFGGLDATLQAVRTHLRPGGQVLFGDTTWERPPSQAAQDALQATPNDFPDLAGLVERAVDAGFEVVAGHVSTLEEWDDYEWSWTGSLVRWALRQPATSPDRGDALDAARLHRDAWLHGYRKELGFVTLVLTDTLGQLPPPGFTIDE